MAQMGDYCKAYYLRDLRAFDGWAAGVGKRASGTQGTAEPVELKDDDHLFLQENGVVTRGIFKDEEIVFDDVTDSWKRFIPETLQFEPPTYEVVTPAPAPDSAGTGA